MGETLDKRTFTSLRRIYMAALGVIAFLILLSQLFIQRALSRNDYDAKIINIAGRQRMLSQKISKSILLWNTPLEAGHNYKQQLREDIKEWNNAHLLLKGNLQNLAPSTGKLRLEKKFQNVHTEINRLLLSANHIEKFIGVNSTETSKHIMDFINAEPEFLKHMNDYVFMYESYAKTKVDEIKIFELATFFLVLIILIAEIFLLFRPATKKIRYTLKELIDSKDKALTMADRANTAVKQKNETLEELQLLQKAINQTLLFARVDRSRNMISAGNRMKTLFAKQDNLRPNIYENLGLSQSDLSELLGLIDSQKGSILNHEYKVHLKNSDIEWLDISVFPIIKNEGIIEHLLVCLDITKRKKAQENIESLRVEKLKTDTALQKSKASLIVEAQEEERKRIAKDIHDSIGQMLTALKFNIESLNIKDNDALPEKINLLKVQTRNIILGVRMATFNLTPPELLDYGVVSAISKMVTQLNKFSKAEIIFMNNSTRDLRFNTLIETNLYRVTQESINNAIKYAKAEHILVSIKTSKEMLSITITDNGKGFDKTKIARRPKGGSEGGMGLFFMKERMEYVNGRVFINSEPGQGTRVVINMPLLES